MIIDAAKSVRVEDEVARRGGLGLKRFGGELVGACPQCGGRDRFAVSIRKQIFLCRGCGRSGDVIALVQHVDQCDFPTAVRTLGGAATLGGEDRKPIAPAKPAVHQEKESDREKTARALKIWDDEASEVNGTLAEVYLRRRGLELPEDDHALRFYSACPFGPDRLPCMVALFRCITTDAPTAIHRIALRTDGSVIGKRMLGRVAGCAVKLDADENVEQSIAIGEGIETMLAARQRGFRPAWALGCAGAVKNFPALNGIEALTIIVDHDMPDKNGRCAGQEAAAECSKRWTLAGREVRRLIPRRQGSDMADLIEVAHE